MGDFKKWIMASGYTSGWCGVPGRPASKSSKVHLFLNGRAVFGVRFGKEAK